jgi:DNA-binding NarL/FixJ family response regulator
LNKKKALDSTMNNQQPYSSSKKSKGEDESLSPERVKWVFNPNMHLSADADSAEDLLESKELYLFALNNIQDGVSILDTDLSVRYVNTSMKHWYSGSGDLLGKKCYQVYHYREEPCDNCPTLKTIEEKVPYIGIVKYATGDEVKGWQQLYSIPIFDPNNNLIGILEYVRDITFQNNLEIELNRIMAEYQNLEIRNEAITQLLAQRKIERELLEETIIQNVEKFIRPSLHSLKSKTNKEDLSLIESLIEEIVYPITRKRSSVLDKLTSREMHIARLIRDGKTSSEIAKELCISKKTVDFHRANIRSKVGLSPENDEYISLRRYLEDNL